MDLFQRYTKIFQVYVLLHSSPTGGDSALIICLQVAYDIQTGSSNSDAPGCSCLALQLDKAAIVMAEEEDEQGFEEELEDGSGGVDAAGHGRRKRLFSKELRCMMYGFGDDQNPYTESVDILEDLVIEFITEMTHKAMSIGRQGRVQVEDIVFLIRKDPRKFARVKDLLTMNEELKRARKAFDEANYGS
uniref:Transcription initiation factor TFIID subunit 13 n=2 Tax=Poecilia reticulata TaxID=8081 RepID=A0A3P9N887_POERE